ncbi:hypothetical protein EC973_005983 [Apophysomyces ossiformis]|uniref:DUF1692-domain-containing protein n=1 Tax=Apophysomyces ossiformis TaxID=679940 RepID=A0A8H7EJY0_9FUNG|nr:hypothetical protein EC973_005983 [Apophysomyces ossiformis]
MASEQWAQKLAAFDAFPKVEVDNQARSEKGGILTVLLACFLALLTLSEFSEYRKLQTNHHFLIDPTIETTIPINMDLTVAMPCPALLVHVYDVTGQRVQVTGDLKLVPAEFSIGTAGKHGSITNPSYIQAIVKAATGKQYDEAVAADMGACRIYGSINANKVAANLHITSVGHGYHSHTHTDHALLNFTHRIDDFSFGQLYRGLVNPLDNSVEIAESHFEIFQYLISVVPTTYTDYKKNILLTNQYAVTDSRKSIDENNAGGFVPGIFFKYDIEPISVHISENRASFTHFLVRLCGIIGGSVVTVGFVYRTLKFLMTGGKEDPQLYAPTHNIMKSV